MSNVSRQFTEKQLLEESSVDEIEELVDEKHIHPTQILAHFDFDEFDIENIEWLLQRGADVNQKDPEGWTPIQNACECADFEMFQLCMKYNAHLCVLTPEGSTLLHIAVASGSHSIVSFLLENKVCGVRAKNFKGITPLGGIHFEAGHENILKDLIRHGADPNVLSVDAKHTVLYKAVASGNCAFVKMLLEHKATPGPSILFACSKLSALKQKAILPLLKVANVNARDAHQCPLVFRAVEKDNLEFLEWLVENGADLRVRFKGMTILHYTIQAADQEYIFDPYRSDDVSECLEFLFKQPLNPYLTDSKGRDAFALVKDVHDLEAGLRQCASKFSELCSKKKRTKPAAERPTKRLCSQNISH